MHAKILGGVTTALLLLTFGPVTAQDAEVEADVERHAAEATIQKYAVAFNSGDAAGMASCWTEQGVYTSRMTDEQISGRAALQEEFAALIAETEDRKVAIDMMSVQLISPSVATQQGTLVVSGGDAETIESVFNVVYVDVDGQWLIDRVTEESLDTPPSHYEQLKVLEWMIGDWVEVDGEGEITASCHWTKNNNYIIRTFSQGGDDNSLSGMQLIGWDPAQKRIRSWAFDSDGGFSEGAWTQKDDSWIVTIKATLADGGQASATSVFRVLDEDRFGWQRVNRVLDGEILPNIDEVVIARQISAE